MKNDLQKESLKQLLLAQKVQLLEKMKQDSDAEKKEKIEHKIFIIKPEYES